MNEHDPTRSSLAALSAGALAPDEEARVREHLAGCKACAEAFARWHRLTTDLERLPQPALPMAAVTRMATRAEAHRQQVLERRWNRLVLLGLAAFGWLFGMGNIAVATALAETWLNGVVSSSLWSSVHVVYLALTTATMMGALPLLWKHRQKLLRNI
jgi:anti-sigma factor RsiW